MEHPRKRVEGARALARAFVLSAETITRVKNLSMPNYRRLTTPYLHDRLSQIHALCRDWLIEINEGEPTDMPQDSRYAPLRNRFWTAEGSNDVDPPIHVGIFGEEREAAQWCHRQNETQRSQEWGRGQAGPMTFAPKKLYSPTGGTGAPDPKRCVYPERMWDAPEDGDATR